VLGENLRIVRETIDKFYGDKGRYPENLEELVAERYLRALPHDPITGSTSTWTIIPPRRRTRRERSTTSGAAPPVRPGTASPLRTSERCRAPAFASATPSATPPVRLHLLGLLILVAILALATSATLTLGSIAQRREAEQRLLEVGDRLSPGDRQLPQQQPGGNRSYPPALADLLKDPRYPGIRRHLRQLYPDPITGKPEWGLVQAPHRAAASWACTASPLPSSFRRRARRLREGCRRPRCDRSARSAEIRAPAAPSHSRSRLLAAGRSPAVPGSAGAAGRRPGGGSGAVVRAPDAARRGR
jgi:type II secretory pathway pseudopilin PulG